MRNLKLREKVGRKKNKNKKHDCISSRKFFPTLEISDRFTYVPSFMRPNSIQKSNGEKEKESKRRDARPARCGTTGVGSWPCCSRRSRPAWSGRTCADSWAAAAPPSTRDTATSQSPRSHPRPAEWTLPSIHTNYCCFRSGQIASCNRTVIW